MSPDDPAHEAYLLEEQAAMEARNANVTDEELVARIRSAPDMGGALLVELSEFMTRRAERQAREAAGGRAELAEDQSDAGPDES